MPTKAKKTVRKSKQGFEFKPWHAFIIIALVVITGYIVVRFSHAASNTDPQAKANVQRDFSNCGNTNTIPMGADNPCVLYVRRFFKDVVNDPSTSETGPMDEGTKSQVKAFQEAVNSAFVLATANYPVPATIDDAKLQELSDRHFIKSPLDAKSNRAIDTDGIVGPMTWAWINTITYVYLVGN
jgi:peptidoglycan hydrolase-like protein with peptidoglycan-binding domain